MDFLFPRSVRVIELENFSPATLLDTLPQAEETKVGGNIAIFHYLHPVVKELIWEVKYRGNRSIAETLGAVIYDVLIQEISDRSFNLQERVLVMPVPISKKRRLERGWNQAELIVEGMEKCDTQHTFKYLARALAKVAHTESQTKTSGKSERLQNLVGSMEVSQPEAVSGKYVVVIDDVTTTEATFREARRALKEAGAEKVLCLAIAH